jgi:DedD protein
MADIAQDPSLPQKKRARRRLVGAAVLCLGLAAGLPFLFDAEPKKSPKNIEEVKVSVSKPTAPTVATPEISAPVTAPVAVLPSKDSPTKDGPKEEPKYEPKYETKPDVKAEAKLDVKPEAKGENKVEPKKPAPATTVSDLIAKSDKPKESTKAEKSTPSPVDKSKADKPLRYLVQIGAFGSVTGAQEQVKRAAAIGLKAFTEDVDTNSGKRIRVRVGPFPSKEAADQAREKLKAAGIDSALFAP